MYGRHYVEPVRTFLVSMVFYVFAQSILAAANLNQFRFLVAALVLAVFASVAIVFLKNYSGSWGRGGFRFVFYLYYTGLIGSLIFNAGELDYGVFVKLLILPMFFAFGFVFELRNKFLLWKVLRARILFWGLVFIPLVVWYVMDGMGIGAGDRSIFSNRNNASLYAVSAAVLYNVLSEKPIKSIILYCGIGIVFGTLGVLFSIVVSLFYTIGNIRSYIALLGASIVLIALMFFSPVDFGVFARIEPFVLSLNLVFGGLVDWQVMSYAELVGMLHTTDLSFIFRLKHWIDIFYIYADAGYLVWFFGLGTGASLHLTEAGLLPHNDYLRIIFECGLLAFVGFLMFVLMVIFRCGRRWETIPLMAISLYFFSENLLDNFAAMSIFFYGSGALVCRFSPQRKCSER